MKNLLIAFLMLGLQSAHSQCTIPTFLNLTDDFVMLTAGETVTVSWSADCPDALMRLLLIKITPLPFQAVQEYPSIPNNGNFDFEIEISHIPGTYQFYIQDIGTNIWTYGSSFILSAVLPVEWSKITQARIEKRSVIIQFSTAQQINNSHFDIEHSQDGRNYQSIGRIEGEGNTFTEMDYEYIYETPKAGMSYYRVKQVDFDDQFSYSNVASLVYKVDNVSVYPNPVTDRLVLNSPNEGSMAVYNHVGLEMHNYQLTEGQTEVDMSNLNSGIYLLKFSDGTIERVVKK